MEISISVWRKFCWKKNLFSGKSKVSKRKRKKKVKFFLLAEKCEARATRNFEEENLFLTKKNTTKKKWIHQGKMIFTINFHEKLNCEFWLNFNGVDFGELKGDDKFSIFHISHLKITTNIVVALWKWRVS